MSQSKHFLYQNQQYTVSNDTMKFSLKNVENKFCMFLFTAFQILFDAAYLSEKTDLLLNNIS